MDAEGTIFLPLYLSFYFAHLPSYSSEASFYLLHARKKKLTVCPDVRLILVLVLGRQIVYGQNTVYLCLNT